jgi:predicted ATPase/serine/threonine protein kinase
MDGSHLDDIAQALPDFVITGQIGRGAFGVVWGARHRRLGREVAVKELAESTLDDDVERFRREARILARLDHPNVVKVFDYREHEGRRLLIMEMLRGGTMHERRCSGMEAASVIEAGIAAAWGLQHAHDHGILHRDVKPGNLMFDERGRVKVTDFGIAGGIDPEGDSLRLTRDGAFLGTPAYAAPEQAGLVLGEDAAAVTEASDQYSLAAALYETLSGELTHDATGGAIALWRRRFTEKARAIHDTVPTLPPAVGDVIMRALERTPSDRFPSMAKFAEALEAASGVVPGERSTTLMANLRTLDPTTDYASHLGMTTDVSRRWPASPSPGLVGRDADADELSALLGRHRLVTIAAPGGTGKTSLAVALARQPFAANRDGTWTVYLANTAESANVPMAVARALDIRDDGSESGVDAIVDRLSEQRAILVLDNCEHVIDAAADLAAAVLARCPQVTIIATSREPLRIDAEHIYRLAQLTVAPAGAPLSELLAASATELFVLRARVHQPSFSVTAENAEAVNAVVRRLDGVPLAVELAAARMRSMAVSEIADRLDQRFRLLTTGERDADPRQRTLRGAIGWSFDLLSPVEQFAFCRVAVFVGGFDLDAAAAVLLKQDADRFDVIDLVDALIEKSLLFRDEDARGRSRYHMLESIREYAREQLAAAGLRSEDEARSVHLDHYLAVADELGKQLVGPQQIEANTVLRADHDNIIAAMVESTTVPHGVDRGLRLASVLHYYWTRNGVAATMISSVELLCDRSHDDAHRAAGYAVLARGYCTVGRAEDALATAQRAVDLTASLGPSTTSLRALQSRALAASYVGDPESAVADIEALYRGAEESDDAIIQAEACSMRSVNLRSVGRTVEARSEVRAVVALYRSLGDTMGYASELINLADNALELGDLDEAEASLLAAEPLVEQLESPILSGYFHGNRGLVALRRGHELIATGEFAKAIVICERINERTNLLNNLIAYVHVLARSDAGVAAQLLAAAQTLATRFALTPDPNEQRLLDDTEQFLRTTLGVSGLELVRQSAADLSMREIAVLVDPAGA